MSNQTADNRTEASRKYGLQMPQLPDPGRNDDNFVESEKLDFSVRLGSTLARGQEKDSKSLKRQLSIQAKQARDSVSSELRAKNQRHSENRISPRYPSRDNGSYRRVSRRASVAKHLHTTNVYLTSPETPLMKLQRIFKTVRIISGVCLALKRYVKACETKTWSFMEMYLHVKKDLDQVVAFNPQSFARVEPERLKLKKLLFIQPEMRSAHDIKVILALMRDNKSFQDYPYHVQYDLARCMTYQSYESRRVILKQGHRPEAFYILLSGFVMANIEDISPTNGKKFSKTVKEMGPGDTFGELALIEGGRRTATIVCKTFVELLVILKDDFDNIIREPLVTQIDEHVSFCRSMALFKDFPCDQLAENAAQFFYHFFKKGDIVVKDSRESKYIIIVKAGTCKVICSYSEQSKGRKSLSSQSKKDMESAFPHYDDMKKISMLHRQPKTEAEKLKESICLGLLTGQIDRTRLADHGPDVQRPKTAMTNAYAEKKSRTPPPLQKSKTLSQFYDSVNKKRQEEMENMDDLLADVEGNFWSKRLQYKLKSNRAVSGKSMRSSGSNRRSGSSKFSRGTLNVFYPTEKQVFAQIAELKEGTVFGLESLVQKPELCLSLVSEGAECIFISKRLFLSLANIKVLRVVTDMISTYPSCDFIQQQVFNYRRWQKYKTGLVTGVLKRRQRCY